MNGCRENWEEWLPVIKAFVEGKEIQRKTSFSNGRWHDTNELYGLLSGWKFRVKPENSKKGVWKIDYDLDLDSDIKGFGTLTVEGLSDDEIVWPNPEWYKYNHNTLRFIPYDEEDK